MKRLIGYGLAFAALVSVFALYTRPQVMVALTDLMWSCFN